ncbi:MAG: plasmid stabilization system protein [Phycisphaerales bacterium]|nr:plasmid stabilization system protein [Phycisphaerales bacterium]
MSYAVRMTPTAEAQLAAAYQYLHDRAPKSARQWLRDVYQAIDALEAMPLKFGVAPEAKYLGEPLRHRIVRSHRIIYRVDESERVVQILYVRHGAQKVVGEPDRDE